MNATLTVSSQGQVVIPVRVRKALGIKPGGKLTLTLLSRKEPPTAIIQPLPASWVASIKGTGKGLWGKGETYIDRERDTWSKK